MEEVVYFELNNWFRGRDYPIDGKLAEWTEYNQFADNIWCKSNRLCVVGEVIDMSYNWCISAPKKWVIENCPEILSDRMYSYDMWAMTASGNKREVHAKRYADFIRKPDKMCRVFSRFGGRFLDYDENNFGSHWREVDEWEMLENENED